MKSKSASSLGQLKWPVVLATVFCLTLAATGPAQARGGRACADDAAKFCKDVQAGGGRVAECLKEHQKDLSPGCKKNMAHAKAKARKMKDACHDDAQKLCKGLEPGGGRILQCLKQHEGELSQACKEQMARPKAKGGQ